MTLVTPLRSYLGPGESNSLLACTSPHSIVLRPAPQGLLASADAGADRPQSVRLAISSRALQTTATLMIGEGHPTDRMPSSLIARLAGGL
jgi:hypothetical protein